MATAGAWLGANFPNLFGSLAGANNAGVAAAVRAASNDLSGQALALGLNIYGTTFALGGQALVQNGLVARLDLQVTLAGAGQATFDVGKSVAAFGIAAGQSTTLTLSQILQGVNSAYNPTSRIFYNGNAVLIAEALRVVVAVNQPASRARERRRPCA